MQIPHTVQDYLRRKGGQFKARVGKAVDDFDAAVVDAHLPAERVLRTTMVTTGKAALMVIHPANRDADLDAVAKLFNRPFSLSARQDLEKLFPECDLNALPPLPEAYGVKAVVDASLDGVDEVYFSPGRLGVFVRAGGEDFRRLVAGSWSRPVAKQKVEEEAEKPAGQESPAEMRERVRRLKQLPAMPGMALQIMKIRNNPYSHVSELAAVVEQDPSLSAQIVRYAASPFFGYQGKVDSVAMAIARVLGMDFVMDLAFGLSLGKSFRNPNGGPLGLNAFWQHATYSAALSQALSLRIPYMRRPAPGVAYLAGLLHNFGFLLLGHLFPEQFARLNAAAAAQPDRPITELEREVLGITHNELGLWLMEDWNMPREIIEAVREHHNAEFRGDFAVYAKLVYIANALLKRHGIGEGEGMQVPNEVLVATGLDEVQIEAALGTVLQSRESLDYMAKKMAA